MSRRQFPSSATSAALVAPQLISAAERSTSTPAAGKRRPLKKGLMYNSFRAGKLSVREKFELAREAGFDGIEIRGSMKYSGWMITEHRRPAGLSDAAYLSHLSDKLDAIFTV
jgi:hypothetical protein